MKNYWKKPVVYGCIVGLVLGFIGSAAAPSSVSMFSNIAHATDNNDNTESTDSTLESPGLVITGLTPEVLTDEQTITISGSATGFTGDFQSTQLQVFLTQSSLQSMDEVDAFVDNSDASSSSGETGTNDPSSTSENNYSSSESLTLITDLSVSEFASEVDSTNSDSSSSTAGESGENNTDSDTDTSDTGSNANTNSATNVYNQANGSLEFSIQVSTDLLPYLSWGEWGPFGLEITLTDTTGAATLTGRTILLRYSQSATTTATGSTASTNIAVLVYEKAGTVDANTGGTNSSVSTVSARDGVSFAVSPAFLYSSSLTDEQNSRRNELLSSNTDLVVTAAGGADLGLLTAAAAALGQDNVAAELLQLAVESKTLDAFVDSHPELADLIDGIGISGADNSLANSDSQSSSSETASDNDTTSDATDSATDTGDTNNAGNTSDAASSTTTTETNTISANILTNYVTASEQWFGLDLFDLGTDQIYLAPSQGLELSADSLVTPTSALRMTANGTQSTDDTGMTVLDSWGQAAQLLAENPDSTDEQLLNRQKLRALSALLTAEDLSDQRTMFVHLSADVQDTNLDSRLAALLDNPWVNGISVSEAANSAISTVERQSLSAVDASSILEATDTLEQLVDQYDHSQNIVDILYQAGSTLEVISAAFNPDQESQSDQSGADQNNQTDFNGNQTDLNTVGENFLGNNSSESNSNNTNDSNDDSSDSSTEETTDNADENTTDAITDVKTSNTYKDIYLESMATLLFPLSTQTNNSTTDDTSAATDTSTTVAQINQKAEVALTTLSSTSDFVQAESTQITLINSSANLPFTITSAADVPLEVQVELVTSDPRLQAQNSVSVTLTPRSSTTVEIPVTAIGNADVTVQVNVTSVNGVTLDQSSSMNVRVYANWEDALMIVVSCILVVLFVGGLIRTIRRGRRRAYE